MTPLGAQVLHAAPAQTRPGHPRPDQPRQPRDGKGFYDCRGVWQELHDDGADEC